MNKKNTYCEDVSKKMREFYQNSEVYYKELQTVANKEHYGSYFKYVNKYAKNNARLLDLGCGLGVAPYYFSLEGFNVYGIDVSSKFLSYSASFKQSNLHYISGSVFNLPFKDGTFDVAGSYDVIEHLPDIETFLRESIRVLKKGGIFVIICPSLITPFTPLKAVFCLNESHSIYTSRLTAFFRVFINFFLVLRKKLSPEVSFYYRKPFLDESTWKREVDAAYQVSPIDLKRFLERHDMEILQYQKDGPNFLHKVIGTILPDFASTVYVVARKK